MHSRRDRFRTSGTCPVGTQSSPPPTVRLIPTEDHRLIPRLRNDEEVLGPPPPAAAMTADLTTRVHAKVKHAAPALPEIHAFAPLRERLGCWRIAERENAIRHACHCSRALRSRRLHRLTVRTADGSTRRRSGRSRAFGARPRPSRSRIKLRSSSSAGRAGRGAVIS